MRLKLPQDRKRFHWTKHSKEKMQQYQLSEKRVKRVLRKPDRVEEGIAPNTIAIMQSTGTKKHPTEIWVMYQTTAKKERFKKIKIISAWRYPAKSPLGKLPPIPEDTLAELEKIIKSNYN
jgi:hypothetical protein